MEMQEKHIIKVCLALLILVGWFKDVTPQLDGQFWWLKSRSSTITTTHKTAPTPKISSFPEADLLVKAKEEIVCCECIQFYLCLNGTIVTDGAGFLDLRSGLPKITTTTIKPAVINVETCPFEGDDFQVCCQPPDVDPSCIKDNIQSTELTLTTPSPYNAPPADSLCECLVYENCNPALVVSNGLGNTSIVLSNGRIVSHDKCHHSLEVCCYLPDVLDADFSETSVTPSTQAITEADCPECVLRHLCDADGYINEDGSLLIDLRIGVGISTKSQKPCPHNLSLVCCRLRNYTTPSEHFVTPPTTLTPILDVKSEAKACGSRNFAGIGTRILGFREGQTQFGEFPWVATLLKRMIIGQDLYPLFLGGASLIHKRVIMTAAHKLQGLRAYDMWIRLGEWDVASEKEILPHQDIFVENIILHPNYNPRTLHNDIALLILKDEAKLDNHINPICLAADVTEVDASSCVINGWGVDKFASSNYQKLMKSIRLPLVDKKTCQKLLRKTRLSKYFKLHESFICAGGEEGVDACKGDGGGPLACRSKADPSRYFQVGITAWGIGCGTKDVPGVYVDVTLYYDWVNSVIRDWFPEPKALPPIADTLIDEGTKEGKQNVKESTKQDIEA